MKKIYFNFKRGFLMKLFMVVALAMILGLSNAIAQDVALLSSWTSGSIKAKVDGKNRMLVVVTGTEAGSGISTTAVTYGGQAMTKVTESSAGTSYTEYSSIFILNEAGIAAATGEDINVTWSASLGEGFSISSAIYENVDQSVAPAFTSSTTATSSLMAPEMNVGNGGMYILGSALANSYTSIDNGFTEELIQLKNSTVDGTQLKWGNTVIHSKTGTGVVESATLTIGSGRGALSAIVLTKAPDTTPAVAILSGWSAGQVKAKAIGKNRMLVVVTGTEAGSGISTTAVTYGGQAMTKVTESSAGTSYTEYSSIFILNEAGIAAATGDDINVTWSASLGEGFSISSAIYENVDQSVAPAFTSSTTTTSSLIAPEMSVGNGYVYILGSALANSYTSIDNGFTEELIQLKNSTVDGTQLKWGHTVIHSKMGTGVVESATLTIGSGRGALSAIVLKKAANLVKTPVIQLDSWTVGTTKTKAAGTKRLLVVTVTGETNPLGNITDLGVTYGGKAMTKIVYENVGTTTSYGNFSSFYILNEADIAAADESGTIALTWTANPPTSGFDVYSSFFDKVDQTKPVSDTSQVNISGTLVTAPAVKTTFGDMVLMSVAFAGQPRTPTYTTGFIQVLNNPLAKSWGSGIIAYKEGDGSEIIPSITNTNSERAALTAIVLNGGEEEGLPPVYYTLTANASVGGTVKVDPVRKLYSEGSVVRLEAIPNFGYNFVNWTDALDGIVSNIASIEMNSDKTVTANFVEKTKYTITTEVSNGSIYLSPTGGTYFSGESVTVTVKPNVGYSFKEWNGDITGSVNPQTIVVDAAKTITAIIEKIPAYTLSFSGDNGTLKVSPRKDTYAPGEAVILIATPNEGFRFVSWGGDLSGKQNPTSMVMNSDKSLEAVFELIPPSYTLTIGSLLNGSVTLDPEGGIYEAGTVVTITATANQSYKFNAWSGDLSGSVNPETITMDGNKSVMPEFEFNTGVNLNTNSEQAMLAPNYPNPFSAITTIPYQLNEVSNVKLTVYNLVGEKVKILVNEQQTPGRYEVVWDARDYNGKQMSNGIYFFKLEIGGKVIEKKGVLMR